MSRYPSIPLGEISSEILRPIVPAVADYSISLFGHNDRENRNFQNYCGSATYVSAFGHRFILTAAHVWEVLQEFPYVGVFVRGRSFVFQTASLDGLVVGSRAEEEWGPDIAFLRLSKTDAGTLSSIASAYNLEVRRNKYGTEKPNTDFHVWAIVGAPAENCEFGEEVTRLKIGVNTSTILRSLDRNGFDYHELAVDLSASSTVSLKGISGGGLWYFPIVGQSTDNVRWNSEMSFEGVAFYQTDVESDQRRIRCHGRLSIYKHGLDAVEARLLQ